MNEDKIKLALAVTTSAVAVTLATRSIINTRREEAAKREQFKTDMRLDIAAIQKAADVVHTRIQNGEILSLNALREAMDTEIAFNKIAIREE